MKVDKSDKKEELKRWKRLRKKLEVDDDSDEMRLHLGHMANALIMRLQSGH